MEAEATLRSKWDIESLLEEKSEVEAANKRVKKKLDELKKDMLDCGVTTLRSGQVNVVVSETERVDMDEAKLIEMLQQLAANGDKIAESCLITKPAVDVTKVEEAVYNNRLDPTIITKATTCKTTRQLRITKLKDK